MSANPDIRVWGDDRGYPATKCGACGQWHFPPFEGARCCYPCWRKAHAHGTGNEALQNRIRELERELAEERQNAEHNFILLRQLKKELAEVHREYGDEIFELRQDLNWAQSQVWELLGGKPKAETIPQDMFKRLLQLCHPDKHDGSEASKQVTQWLLQQREARHD